ncbi:MAG: DUF3050 domain-containing protein [Luteibaculum sp.]
MSVEEITRQIEPLRHDLLNHSLYDELGSVEQINTFMEQHLYAVWDFMSMVKWLQRKVTCVDVPWVPSKIGAKYQRFINEIVLAEETDFAPNGEVRSHFNLYLDAMQQSGADAQPALDLIKSCAGKKDVVKHLRQTLLPGKVLPFLEFTFNLLQNGKPHQVASAFTFGREDLIPDMFVSLVKKLNKEEGNLSALVYYLERHIELDGEEHGPMALELVTELCGKNERKWEEATVAAKGALQARIHLWNGILDTVKMKERNVRVFA